MKTTKSRHILNEVLVLYQFIYVIGIRNEVLSVNELIYILTWEEPHISAMLDGNSGRHYFIDKNCTFQNCYLTENRSLLSNVTYFNAILFHAVTFKQTNLPTLPSSRSINQKYILMSNEPAILYPMPSYYNNGFFNYTFTYKLNSDTTWKFFVVRNERGEIVAPKLEVVWRDVNDMEPINEETKRKLQSKNKTAAWFVSHCITLSQRENFVQNLISDLKSYNLTVDIIGYCGNLYCTQWDESCHDMIETDYYFYLAFENSMCDDYITEKILTATKHFAVPIVYGGANYSRCVFYLILCRLRRPYGLHCRSSYRIIWKEWLPVIRRFNDFSFFSYQWHVS